ncbi:unnamed protein product [Closterium sp. NIES-54]
MLPLVLVLPPVLLLLSLPLRYPPPLLHFPPPSPPLLPPPPPPPLLPSPTQQSFCITDSAIPTSLHFAPLSPLASFTASLPPYLPSPPLLLPHAHFCIHGKLKHSPHHSHPTFAAAPIDLVHMDLWGPYPIRSHQGHRYMLILVDDHSRYSTVFFLHTKDQVPVVVINWAEQCHNHFKCPIGRLHSDGGGEFINNTLATFCKRHGIQQTSTLPHSPQQNDIAENRIREITKIARCLIAHASTPPSLWSYALLHADLLLNLRSHPQHPSSSPTELWSKAKPDAAGLGLQVLRPHPTSRSLPCRQQARPPVDVVFDESIPYYSTPPPDPLPPPSRPFAWTDTVLPPLLPPSPLLPPQEPGPHQGQQQRQLGPQQGQQQQQQHSGQQQQPTQQQGQQQQHRAPPRSSPFLLPRMHTRSFDRVIGAPPPASIQLLEDSHEEFLNILHHTPFTASIFLDFLGLPVLGATSTPTIFTPSTFKEAIACPDADRWIAAIFLECEAFIRNDSFVDVPLPADANLVEGKWVFRVKQLPREDPVYKARYYAKGFTQTWAEDYWFTYAPTTKPPTLRTLLDIGARDDMEIWVSRLVGSGLGTRVAVDRSDMYNQDSCRVGPDSPDSCGGRSSLKI